MSLRAMDGDNSKSRDRSPYRDMNEKTEQICRDLIRKRAIVKGRLTKFNTYLNNIDVTNMTSQSKVGLKLRVQGASILFSEFNEIQSKVEEIVPDSDIDEQLDQRQLFEDTYYSTLAQAESILSDIEGITNGSNTCQHAKNHLSVKLPTITLPTFDGLYEHWLEYRDTYLSLVHNSTEISDIQKFHYLKSSLKGSAELVINALEISSSNYPIAWELLINRYDNSRLLVHSHVKALFSIQSLHKESPSLIRKLIDVVINNLRALKILDEPTQSWDTLIIYIVVSKLDRITEREWEEHKGSLLSDSKTKLKVDQLLNFLKHRADLLETLALSHSKDRQSNSDVVKKPNASVKTQVTHCNTSSNKTTARPSHRLCVVCNGKHPLYTCTKFTNMDLQAKRKVVNDHNLCENCLRSGHTIENCLFGPCKQCNKKHNSLLHPIDSNSTASCAVTAATETSDARTPHSPPLSDSLNNHSNKEVVLVTNTKTHTYTKSINVEPVLLSTALVEIPDIHNNYHTACTLLDSGSQSCFITQSFCKRLNIPLLQSTHEIRGIGNSISHALQSCDIEVKSRVNAYSMNIKCFVLKEIMSSLPPVQIQDTRFKIPDNVQLANTQFLGQQNIDVLIGADRFWDLLIDGKIRLPNGPFLQNTKLGWIISGPINNISRGIGHIQCNFTQSMDKQLRQFWELEELPSIRDTHTDEERACEHSFATTTTRDSSGRFCVHIPLKESADALGESFLQAERRFLSLEKRLSRAPISYKELYTEFIHEYINLNHMTRIHTYANSHYFMPHHGVFREHSTTTRLRVVFDASAATSNGKSFNDIQLVGPPIQGDLLGILLRFRQFRYTAVADCEKMYRQVTVNPSQRDLQLIIWRDDPNKPLEFYRLNTVTYGTASAPFLSVRCLKQLAAECTDPRVKRVINDDFYVDDLLTSCEDKVELLNICKKTVDVLNSGCFPLRKWNFNFKLDDESLPVPLIDNQMFHNLNLGEHSQCRTLGLGWCNVNDTFNFTTQIQTGNTTVSKRVILSTVSQIFDPLGLLCPSVIIGKVLLQSLWLLKLEWDDPLPADIEQKWHRFVKSLDCLHTITIPRHVYLCNSVRTELHIFTDASQTAYGACAYVRTINNNNVMVRLLIAKGKVAPLKPISIPRLELCGALLGARLYDKIRNSLTRAFDDVTFWSDSTIVLGWLRMSPNLLKTFVQNRVAEIHELTTEFPWRHVSGKENPADLVSRGVNLEDLSSSHLWWTGPPFLQDIDLSDHLNSLSNINNVAVQLPELKSKIMNSLIVQCDDHNTYESFFPFSRFSQFSKMNRVAAYVFRFVYNVNIRDKSRWIKGVITASELKQASYKLARLSQMESFKNEYDLLVNRKNLKTNNKFASLNPFIDNEKIVRVGGRISASSTFNYNKKHPILLSSNHMFTILLFRHEHVQSLHAGPQALLYRVRENWWPLSGRNLARKVTHDCVICKRLRGKTLTPLMGELPKERITSYFPFFRVGVDYAGPVFILSRKGRGAKLIKSYICLFVCFATRAIHLELVSDLSSDAYVLSLKRFIARRGKPAEIFSDNGRNFVGVKNDFAQFLLKCHKDIADFAKSQSISFTFIPPYSPHFGGLWEAGVKSCKYHLRRVVGNAHLTFEELTTVLTQIEAVLNSRPLSPMSSDVHDLLPLSPGHFLIGRPLTAPVIDDDLRDSPLHRLTRYQRVEQLRQQFWSRWANEYISELQIRTKWKQNKTDLKPDTLVIIKDMNLPPLNWKLGRIVKTIPGKDGVARVADIQTSSGIVRRPYAKICPLVEEINTL